MKRKIFWLGLIVTAVVCSCFEDKTKSPDYTGNWQMGEFVDEFNTKTGEKFFSKAIYGAKTGKINSEYTDSVGLTCIVTKNSIQFEIGGTLTSQTYNRVTVKIQDKDGKRYDANTRLNPSSRRIIFDADNSAFLAQKFIEGGPVKFIVSPLSPASSGMTFEMSDLALAYFENAYKKVTQ